MDNQKLALRAFAALVIGIGILFTLVKLGLITMGN